MTGKKKTKENEIVRKQNLKNDPKQKNSNKEIRMKFWILKNCWGEIEKYFYFNRLLKIKKLW